MNSTSCPFTNHPCTPFCEFYSGGELITREGKETQCKANIALDDLNAIREVMEWRKNNAGFLR